MTTQIDDLQATIQRGARVAFCLDNPQEFGTSFEAWLGRSVSVTRMKGRSEIAGHLAELCDRAISGNSRFPLKNESRENQQAVHQAYAALQGVLELEELARINEPKR